jgi:hypothetical protein
MLATHESSEFLGDWIGVYVENDAVVVVYHHISQVHTVDVLVVQSTSHRCVRHQYLASNRECDRTHTNGLTLENSSTAHCLSLHGACLSDSLCVKRDSGLVVVLSDEARGGPELQIVPRANLVIAVHLGTPDSLFLE